MWQQIRSNQIKSVMLITVMGALLLAVGYVIGLYFFENAVGGLIIAAIGHCLRPSAPLDRAAAGRSRHQPKLLRRSDREPDRLLPQVGRSRRQSGSQNGSRWYRRWCRR